MTISAFSPSETSRKDDGKLPPAEWPFITINILAYNRRDELRITLQKITRELDYPADCLEIIVVDNASTDGTAEIASSEFPSVRIIRSETNAGTSSWNYGFAAGRGDYFLVLDDDCYISGDSLQRAVREAEQQRADLVSFLVSNPFVEGEYFNDAYDPGLLSFWGCSALISRRAIERLGGFDPLIFAWGHELEFTIRFLNAGFKHLYLPEVVSFHCKKPPEDGWKFDPFSYKYHARHVAYIASKLFRLSHAVPAITNVFLRALVLTLKHRSPAVAPLLPSVAAGLAAGLRNRCPVKPIVSKLYKDNFIDFANPLFFIKSQRRFAQFRASRPEFFPDSKAALEL